MIMILIDKISCLLPLDISLKEIEARRNQDFFPLHNRKLHESFYLPREKIE